MWDRLSNDKRRVEWVLENKPQARGDDAILEFWVDYLFYGVNILTDKMSFKQFRALPRQDTLARRGREIRRARPELQPTDRVINKRARRESVYHNNYSIGQAGIMDYLEG